LRNLYRKGYVKAGCVQIVVKARIISTPDSQSIQSIAKSSRVRIFSLELLRCWWISEHAWRRAAFRARCCDCFATAVFSAAWPLSTAVSGAIFTPSGAAHKLVCFVDVNARLVEEGGAENSVIWALLEGVRLWRGWRHGRSGTLAVAGWAKARLVVAVGIAPKVGAALPRINALVIAIGPEVII